MPTSTHRQKCHPLTLHTSFSALAPVDVAIVLGTAKSHAIELMATQAITSRMVRNRWITSQDAVLAYVQTLIDNAVGTRGNETSASKRKAKSRG